VNDRFRRPARRTGRERGVDNSSGYESGGQETTGYLAERDSARYRARQRRNYDADAAEPVIQTPRRHQRVSAFWLVPVVAALLGLYLAASFYSEQGPQIQISFDSAEGLEAGKTPIRYRDVNIGVVDTITLSSDLERVVVNARMSVDSRRYLNDQARFWVVRPRVGTSGVSGLGTLLSGAYIQAESVIGGKFKSSFEGLEQPPLTDTDAPGLRLKLRAEEAGYVGIGSPVYFRQVKVGQIEGQQFLENYSGVEFTIFIDAPHHKIIRNTTKFWNVSGVDLTLNSSGFRVRTPSLEGLAQGGVAFGIIEEYAFPTTVEDGHVFTLHPSRDSAREEMIKDFSTGEFFYVIHFDESVRGLSKGAPVEYKGVQVGSVTDINLVTDPVSSEVRVPVHIELQPERVRGNSGLHVDDPDTISLAIKNGLRAKLQTGNLLTGQLFVALDMYDEPNTSELEVDSEGTPIMPSVASDLQQVTEGVQQALATINELPLLQIAENAESALVRTNSLLEQLEVSDVVGKIDGAIGSADSAIGEYGALARKARRELDGLLVVLEQFISTANESMAGIAPDSPLYYNLLNTLQDIQSAARAVLAVSESVERKPEEFLFGK